MPDKLGHYTWPEFRQKTGKGPQDYVKYQRYVANVPKRRAAARAAAAADPLAPVAYPVAQKRAVQQADFAYRPAIQAQNQQYQQQAALLTKALTQYTKGLAGSLPNPATAYGWARQQAGDTAATAAALGANATGQAAQGQGAVADYLKNISAPDASQHFATDVGARGAFTAGNLATIAQAGQENILNKGGGLAQFQASLPGIAAIGGRQSLRGGLLNLSNKNTAAVADLRSGRGKAIADYLGNWGQLEASKGVANLGVVKTGLQQQGANQRSAASNAARVRAAQVSAGNKVYPTRVAKNGSLVQILPGGKTQTLLPPGSFKVPAAAGKGSASSATSPSNSRILAGAATALAQKLHDAKVVVNAPTIGQPGYNILNPSTTKKDRYDVQAARRIMFNYLWNAMKNTPGIKPSYVRSLANGYVNAAYGVG